MTAGVVKERKLEKHLEKQMGCMAGFLQIFDRHQLLNGKRIYSAKRLPHSMSSQAEDSSEESEQRIVTPPTFEELKNQQKTILIPSPDRFKQSPTVTEVRSPPPRTPISVPESQPPKSLTLPAFEFKEGTRSSWKFAREAPRLSLDSRATTDSKGILHPKVIRTTATIMNADGYDNSSECDDNEKQRRSPSVIARLMGLEPLPQPSDPEPANKAELRRSSSESRVSKDLYQYRFVDGNTFQLMQSHQTNSNGSVANNVIRGNAGNENRTYSQRSVDTNKYIAGDAKAGLLKAHHRGMGQRKSFFDSTDFFPEPKQSITDYNEIEKRLKMRGITEPSKDLETLKEILEALQLKGLLHSKKGANQINPRNFVYEQNFLHDESPIVVMKPARSLAQINRKTRIGGESPSPSFRSRHGARRDHNLSGETLSSSSPRRDRPDIEQNTRNQNRGSSLSTSSRCESSVKSPNKRRPLSIDTQGRKGNNDAIEQRRVSPVQSPKPSPRRVGSIQHTTNRSPRNKKPTAEIYTEEKKVFPPVEDESSMSESSISTSSQTDTDRLKMEEYKEGRSLLERCDKLLHSIAEITTSELQPSPVSVLDSSFYKEDLSPSPIMKRSIAFKDQPIEQEDDTLSLEILAIESDDGDLMYITEILRASNYLPKDSDVFLLLENQQYLKGKDTSKVSRLQRRLIFDTISEIVNRKHELPPWKVVSLNSTSGLKQIWSEFQRIRERHESEDLFEVICGILRKDLAEDTIYGWGDCPIEMSETVLDIERLIFKDLIGETVRDLTAYGVKFSKLSASCRKLVF